MRRSIWRRGIEKRCQVGLGNLWRAFVTWIGDDPEQFLDAIAADRRDDSELCKMGTDRIDHRGLLADEEMAGAWSIKQLCCSAACLPW